MSDWKRYVPILFIISIVILALLQAHPLFFGKYTWNFASIEGAYITQSKFLRDNFPITGWQPLWYGGYPFKLSYSPGFLYIINAFSFVLNVGVEEAYRRVAAFSLIFLPLALYVFAWRLSVSHVAAFLTSLFYVTLPSAHRTIYEFPNFPPYPDYVTVTALYGETPHILGLALALLTSALFYHYTVKRKKIYGIFLPFAICFVNLTNLIAAVSLAVIIIGIAVLEGWGAIKRLILAYLLAIGLGIFAYDPEYIQAAIIYAQMTMEGAPLTLPLIITVIVILAASYAASKYVHSKNKPFIATSLLLTLFFLMVTLSNRFASIGLLPQAVRYGSEFDAFLCGLVSSSLVTTFVKLKRRSTIIIAILLSVVVLVSFLNGLTNCWTVLRSGDLEHSIERRVAEELDVLFDNRFGPRVYATGSIAFWINVFTDVPQLRGGYDLSGSFNLLWSHLSYFINTNRNSSLILLWLKAYNIRYVVVDMPWASLPYKDYLYPEKFEGVLRLVKEVDGVRIYEVPLSCPEPLQLVRTGGQIPIIDNLFDLEDLRSYLELVDNCDESVTFQYTIENDNLIKIRAYNLDGEYSLLFKTNYDNRWVAYANGKKLSSRVVGPNFILFEMKSVKDDVDIEIKYSNNYIDLIYDALSAAVMMAMLAHYIKRKSSRFAA